MAEYIDITVHPSVQTSGELTVRDAMQQVLDFLELIEKADYASVNGPQVIWLLRYASTNSPFTVKAEGVSSDPSISVLMQAARAKRTLQESMSLLLSEGRFPDWMDGQALRTTKRLLERNLNGISRTQVTFDKMSPTLDISPNNAQRAVLSIDKALLDQKLSGPNLTRTEYGSAEGDIVAAVTYYGHPALILRERLSGDRITCVLSDEAAEQIGSERRFADVWSGQRVLTSGALHYNAEGRIAKIDAESLEVVHGVHVDLNEIRALDITSGMTPMDYLDWLRDVDHGQA